MKYTYYMHILAKKHITSKKITSYEEYFLIVIKKKMQPPCKLVTLNIAV